MCRLSRSERQMMRIFAWAMSLTATFALMILLTRGIEPPPVMVKQLATGACTQPCWHGIRPAQTLEQAQSLLRTDEAFSLHKVFYAPLCWIAQSEVNWQI